MPFTAPVTITIPPAKVVAYTAPPTVSFKSGVEVRDRQLLVSFKGTGPDASYPTPGRECRYREVIGLAEASRLIVAWHDTCGPVPRVRLTAAGATRPTKVVVQQVWLEGPVPPPEPDDEPITTDPAQFGPDAVACGVDPDGDGPETFQPADVEPLETDPPMTNVFRITLTPIVPVTP